MTNKKCTFKNNNTSLIEWKIIPQEVQNVPCEKHSVTIFDALFDTVEMAGKFECIHNTNKKCSQNKIKCTIISETNVRFKQLNKGSTSSVKAEHGLCNFHTHPLICYKGMAEEREQDKCIWGWPSGEDMRESICFLMRGNLIHLIFALEGTYAVQVNPEYLKILNTLNKNERGTLISIIENYFRATHGFRNLTYNREQVNVCYPTDWLLFANNFTLNNLYETKNKCSKQLSCNGIPDYNKNSSKNNFSLKEYFDQFEMENYECSKKGHIRTLPGELKYNKKQIKYLISKFDKVNQIKNFKKGQWFKVQFSPNYYDHQNIIKLTKQKKLNADQIYRIWTDYNLKNKLTFGTKPITFKTIKPDNECTLSVNNYKQNIKGKKIIHSFGRNIHKR